MAEMLEKIIVNVKIETNKRTIEVTREVDSLDEAVDVIDDLRSEGDF